MSLKDHEPMADESAFLDVQKCNATGLTGKQRLWLFVFGVRGTGSQGETRVASKKQRLGKGQAPSSPHAGI
jgi:hypothetical protein